ncbi:multidrug efflux pump [Ereboglobus sp. PH5-10]|uniref:efflux RND transporter permease subunit n=1 Tax=Ereboglobus sp. PH5-10 TaxID=2940629 RepID=UPI0024056FBF|nr:efflux RND transporter permease subunit [Ereboglobus sp. PH5-10]MDF9826592.1 multidrug efflux pump [Ereboglobus sp. PH5-10]
MAKFFIDRPVFAWVIAIFMMLAGLLSINTLSVSQYPDVSPPAISISAMYPGASAKTVQDSVAQIIEQQMTGIDNMRYMESTSNSDGSLSMTITFEVGTDPDIAQMQVQNKMQLALPLLPDEVQDQGVTVQKATRNFLMMVSFYSTDNSMSDADIADYVETQVRDPLSRVAGVGDVQFFGAKYAMRIWVNPHALTNYNMSISEVLAAISAQNAQVSVGELSGTPSPKGQRLTATITAQTYLTTAEQFENIMVRVNPDGSQVLLKDVARIEKDKQSYYFEARYKGQPSAGCGIKLASGANALATSDRIHAEVENLSKFFPPSLAAIYPMDTAPFVRISIEEVVKTLLEAIVLVFLVMFLFLQNIRATIIPTIAVPVVLLGTFAVLAAFGFTINTLTMFGLVLAIGLLVDDAIVVVENVERVMSEEGLSPKEATKKSMGQITGALVGIAMVLAAVFTPMAFFGGSTGVIYRQFSITIASAMILSVVIAIVLTPALCATMLKPLKPGAHGEKKRGFFGWFNKVFDRSTNGYERSVAGLVKRPLRVMLIYVGITVAMGLIFVRLPKSFLPSEDQGYAVMQAILPPGSTQEQTVNVLKEVERYFLEEEKDAVETIFTICGFSFGGRGQNASLGFIKLYDWDERLDSSFTAKVRKLFGLKSDKKDNSVDAVVGRAMAHFSKIKVALTFAFTPPAIAELGIAGGFEMRLLDREGMGHDALTAARQQLIYSANMDPAYNQNLVAVRLNGMDDTPQFHLNIDLEKVSALGLSIAEVNQTLSIGWASRYIGDFIDRGRVKRIYIQGDAPYRMMPEDIGLWYARNNKGEMVPFSDFTTTHWEYGSTALDRFNGFPSVTIQGSEFPGKSTGLAMDTMEQIVAEKLPAGVSVAWSGLSYEEKQSGAQAGPLYAISLIVVFLCLAALYESWTVPISVILVVPLGLIGAVLAVWSRNMTNDVYFQVGMITTVGLSCKNAILIVEFAKDGFDRGMGLLEATVHAARLRLRPILMTSLAFGCGVVPLAISTGAGAGSQNAIGTSVLGGVITGTVLALFFVPVLFVVVTKLFRSKPNKIG